MTTKKTDYVGKLSKARYENAVLFVEKDRSLRTLFEKYCKQSNLPVIIANNTNEAIGQDSQSNHLGGIVGEYAKRSRFFPFVVSGEALESGKILESRLRNSYGNHCILPPKVYLSPSEFSGELEIPEEGSLIRRIATKSPENLKGLANKLGERLKSRFPMYYGDRVLLVHGGKKQVTELGNELIGAGIFLESVYSEAEAIRTMEEKAAERTSFPVVVNGSGMDLSERRGLPVDVNNLVRSGKILEPYIFDSVNSVEFVKDAYHQVRALNQ